ncbi:glycoside hydrolase family 18 protein [Stipitochalara longipes BDJ]|nr:glycoside hydrolase family 18 protein [Stipitochalara longipes BDJ]
MFSTKSFAAATAAFALFASSTADYNPSGKGNTAVYWGAGGNQKVLSAYCNDPSIDIIPVAFINAFPPQANGLIGVGMASNTVDGSPFYKGPGYAGNPPDASNDKMYTDCSPIANALYTCQQTTKTKFLLSLGGAVGTYNLNNATDGIYLANLLWGAFGPYNSTWVANGGIRPFDVSPTQTIEFDGFDFDIEIAPNSVAGYTAAITQLRTLFAQHNQATGCNKEYLITGAPQCPLPDTNMSDMINQVAFDIVWPQFYNNPGCSARNWVTNTKAGTTPGFNFDTWQSTLASGASKNAQLYIGLLGGPQGTSATYAGDYLNPTEAKSLIGAVAGESSFGGVMIWDAVSSDGSVSPLTGYTYRDGTPIPATAAYYDVVKDLLGAYATSYSASAPVCTATSSSSSSSSTPSPTSSSTATTSSAAATTSSSSGYPTTPTSTSSAATTASGAPVHEPSVTSNGITCQRIGCYTEGYQIRALTPIQVVNYGLMSPELCAAQCNLYPYAYMGVEYGGECYCGNQINNGSTLVADSDCSMPCDGFPGEYCGAGNRLDMYQCGPAGGSTPSSSPAASTSSPAASSSSPAASTSSAAATTSYPATSPSSTSSPAASSSSPSASSYSPAASSSSPAASSSTPAASTSSAAATTSYPATSPSSSSYPASPSSSSSPVAAPSSSSSYPGSLPSSVSYSPSASSSSSPVASSSSAPYYPSNSTITSSPYPTTSSPGGVAVSTSSYPATITETYTTTTVRTITSCAAT